ncbi:F-box protein At5g46170-like [Humulus lupulus]|uniref:F-box protein At5g46170-like n=1 Tax=Humulus lupulus TaxID=3486 RepID=UPI002B402676|nr:F-box protein At5g46170-like [Humulus lupulus]
MRFSRENFLGTAKTTPDSHHEHEEEEEAESDYFDQLPDDILLVIFNKVLDAKSLVQCLSISKRFNSLIPRTDSIFLHLPRKIQPKKPLLKSLLNNYIPKSIRFLKTIVSPNNKPKPNKITRNDLFYPADEALKNFKETKSLHLEVPCASNGENDESFLKWTAEFGTNLQSCVILGGNSVKRGTLQKKNDNGNSESSSPPPQQPVMLSDEELKLRIVWMISSLMAASARHYVLKRVVGDFPALANVVVSDEKKRGKLSIGAEQLAELRSNSENDDESSTKVELESSLERSLIPDLKMKLWYVPELELPGCGRVMSGATLVVIKPMSGAVDNVDGVLGGGFDGDEEEKSIVSEAVAEMMKMKKTYVMEMTSF